MNRKNHYRRFSRILTDSVHVTLPSSISGAGATYLSSPSLPWFPSVARSPCATSQPTSRRRLIAFVRMRACAHVRVSRPCIRARTSRHVSHSTRVSRFFFPPMKFAAWWQRKVDKRRRDDRTCVRVREVRTSSRHRVHRGGFPSTRVIDRPVSRRGRPSAEHRPV